MRTFNNFRRGADFLAIACFSTLALPSLANPCLYVGSNADTRVINRSGEISTPYPTAISAHDCRRLRVATGSVTVYVVNAANAYPTTSQITQGQLVNSSEPSAPIGAGTFDIIKQFTIVLEGVNRTKSGSSRGAEEEYLLSALPTGKLSEPKNDLLLELGPSSDQNLTSFEILQGTKSLYRQSGPNKSIKLPQSTLKVGSQLRWKLDYAGKKYEGQFTVEPVGQLQSLKQSMISEPRVGADPIADALRVASVLIQEGYGWEARVIIKNALVGPQENK